MATEKHHPFIQQGFKASNNHSMRKYTTIAACMLSILSIITSCKKYLDVVPDDVATIDNAFATRTEAKKYLFTCYSYMPKNGDVGADPAMQGGDEIWRIVANGGTMFNIALGYQNIVSPYGDNYWTNLYKGLRDCSIFLDNIGRVPDIGETERRQWIAEVKVLQAYYQFYLVRMYGPIPLIKTDLSINASPAEVQVARDPVDSCFKYIVQLIDEARENLPLTLADPSQEAGRITLPIALSLKAEVLVTAASPLFNGNTDEAGLKNHDGTQLFNTTFSKAKWDSAVVACREAIDVCTQAGIKLYYFQQSFQQYALSDTMNTQMSIRNSMCEKWNSEIIWANTQSMAQSIQALAMTYADPLAVNNFGVRGELSPPLKIAEMFYSKNGVPINEDKTWNYSKRYSLRTSGPDDSLYIRGGYTTAALNFDREPRFYADLGFDGGVWYGQGKYDDSKKSDLYYVQAKNGQPSGPAADRSTVTGYFIKKIIHYQNVVQETNSSDYSINTYPWPIMRLSDLYLLYAEALNESEGPGPEVYKYIDLVRERAGLQSVESSWTNYSTNPTKFTSQVGMRSIIHQERLIELAFEGQRFWDLRRWKEALSQLNTTVEGWDIYQSAADQYYRPKVIYKQTFTTKDYFWPIRDANITTDQNLVQNLGW